MNRVLCAECLKSLGELEAALLEGRLLCPDCLPLVRRRMEMPAPQAPEPTRLAWLRDEILASCRGRWWIPRLPLLLWFAWLLWGRLDHPLKGSWWWYSLDLGIHELGHYVFAPLGRFMGILGGSLLQCLAPVLAMFMFWRQRDVFAIAICFGWLSENLFDVAAYAGDARDRRLVLITPGGNRGHAITHDWSYLLSTTGLLAWDHAIAGFLRACAAACTGICLLGGGALLALMARSRPDFEAGAPAASPRARPPSPGGGS